MTEQASLRLLEGEMPSSLTQIPENMLHLEGRPRAAEAVPRGPGPPPSLLTWPGLPGSGSCKPSSLHPERPPSWIPYNFMGWSKSLSGKFKKHFQTASRPSRGPPTTGV